MFLLPPLPKRELPQREKDSEREEEREKQTGEIFTRAIISRTACHGIATAQRSRLVNCQRFFRLFPDHVVINSARCPGPADKFQRD